MVNPAKDDEHEMTRLRMESISRSEGDKGSDGRLAALT